ncbi:hypothetical protein I215_06472 [Galbibacter marinus]|uniref:Uncharacterized protein n=1 Tax=Galbibacter marinus TaxID=555500 RepID=K2P3F0_9FLAO|nr:hypothetical protein [Galbibacter marinus]EKF55583.1 hypothetical protein I215_06472 [Galbibacter marinus]
MKKEDKNSLSMTYIKQDFPATKRYYFKSQIPIAKSFRAELKNGDVFEVGILKIQNRVHFVVKTPIDDSTINGDNKV